MNKRYLYLFLAFLMLLDFSAEAQTRGETNQYNNVVKRPSVKAADRFLKRFPKSVYVPKVLAIKDSLIVLSNTSDILHEDALRIAGDCLDAIGWKRDDVDHVIALDQGLDMRILSPEGEYLEARSIPVYTLLEPSAPINLVLPLEVVAPLGKRNYLHFAYLNGNSEYVEVLYLPEEDIVNQVMFYGNPLPLAEGETYKIEGQSPEKMDGLSPTAEVMWLTARLDENPLLRPLAHEDLLTDESVKWWLGKNPNARTSASKLSFGRLDPESSIVAAYKKARKEKGRNSNVAVFDIRGYTVVCAASKAGGEYTLVWCEPVCKNKKTDRFLNSVYFDADGTTLNLFYYKGNTIFKYKISLPSQTIRR